MSDALPIPPRTHLDQYEKSAKDLQSACKSGLPQAFRDWAARLAQTTARLPGLKLTAEVRRQIVADSERLERPWLKLSKTDQRVARCTLAGARLFLAHAHGFASWPGFKRHVQALAHPHSPVSRFEAAVDAIVDGDSTALRRMLRKRPELVRARSTRDHRSTLLHYVSANGVEDFRQRTPKNIVEIARLLLNAGADVNAESDAYGGRSTTLGLTATSWHPEKAGVQLPLLELLLGRGAIIDGPDGGSGVNACLHNGRGRAAEFLASRGARLDLEAAAGTGRLDAVGSFFNEDGSLKPPATPQQLKDGFAWACEFGRTHVVEFLLQRGTEIGAKLKHDGQTGLHWAAFGGHADIVRLLLRSGAPVDERDNTHNGTPLGWALFAWGNLPKSADRAGFYESVALLVRAGAKLDPRWYEENDDRRRAAQKMRADPRMRAALRGKYMNRIRRATTPS